MNVIALTSGKGGVGKTTLSSSLAVAMQARGARVLVIDADLGLADMTLAFGVTPVHTLADVAAGKVGIADAIVTCPSGVKLLPAYAGSFELANLDDQRRHALMASIDELPGDFDTVLVDTGAGIGATAMSFAAAASETIIVTTRDPQAIADAYATIKVLSQRFGVRRVSLLANMVDSAQDAEAVFDMIDRITSRFLNVSIAARHYVCRDSAVQKAWRAGQPVVADAPQSPAAQCIAVIAERILRDRRPVDRGSVQLFWRRFYGQGEATV